MWSSAHCDLINTINSTCVFYHLTHGTQTQAGPARWLRGPRHSHQDRHPELHARAHMVEKCTNFQNISSDLNHGTCVPNN